MYQALLRFCVDWIFDDWKADIETPIWGRGANTDGKQTG